MSFPRWFTWTKNTLHMHFLHVPVTSDGRLDANRIYTRQSLRKMQSGLPTHLQSRGFAIERGMGQTFGSTKKHLYVGDAQAYQTKKPSHFMVSIAIAALPTPIR